MSYYVFEQYNYAPMIEDDLFISLFPQQTTVGALAIEKALGRRLKVEELKVCLLSVNYFLFGRPIITNTQSELVKLDDFADLIANSVNRNETNAIKWEIKNLNKRLLARKRK